MFLSGIVSPDAIVKSNIFVAFKLRLENADLTRFLKFECSFIIILIHCMIAAYFICYGYGASFDVACFSINCVTDSD